MAGNQILMDTFEEKFREKWNLKLRVTINPVDIFKQVVFKELLDTEQQHVEREQDRHGNVKGADIFLDIVRRKKLYFQFIVALEECGYSEAEAICEDLGLDKNDDRLNRYRKKPTAFVAPTGHSINRNDAPCHSMGNPPSPKKDPTQQTLLTTYGTQIQELEISIFIELCELLNKDNAWQELANKSKKLDRKNFNGIKQSESPAESFLDHPLICEQTVGWLIELTQKCPSTKMEVIRLFLEKEVGCVGQNNLGKTSRTLSIPEFNVNENADISIENNVDTASHGSIVEPVGNHTLKLSLSEPTLPMHPGGQSKQNSDKTKEDSINTKKDIYVLSNSDNSLAAAAPSIQSMNINIERLTKITNKSCNDFSKSTSSNQGSNFIEEKTLPIQATDSREGGIMTDINILQKKSKDDESIIQLPKNEKNSDSPLQCSDDAKGGIEKDIQSLEKVTEGLYAVKTEDTDDKADNNCVGPKEDFLSLKSDIDESETFQKRPHFQRCLNKKE